MANTVYLLLGTNLGDRAAHLARATAWVGRQAGTVRRLSGLYETEPWGVADQPDYWNQAVELQTSLSPDALLRALQQIEQAMGRVRRVRWEARCIDIDILYYGEQIIAHEFLQVPHPRLAGRRFALAPLAELAPDFVHPVLGQTNQQLLAACTDPLAVRLLPL